MQPEQQLSPHFWLSEFTLSQAATRLGLKNDPIPGEIGNLRRVAKLLEEVRTALGDRPILISSGYRSEAVNRAVGGAANSAHVDGRAADFTCPSFGAPLEIAQRLVAAHVVFDQLIFERTWVHIGVAPIGREPRQQTLTACFNPGHPTVYAKGLMP